jgi:hypothetical protein
VTTTGDRVIVEEGELVEARSLAELRATLAKARAEGDWDAYWQALLEVAALGTREAEALLVAVMGDPTLHLKGAKIGRSFYLWLRESRVPGILEAARARAEIETREQPDARWRGSGWLSLVALHGGPAELAWIEALGTGRNWEMEVDRALAEGARNPIAAQRLAQRIEDPNHFLWSRHLDAFALENPAAAFTAALQALPGTRTKQREELLRLLGAVTTRETLPTVRSLLGSIEGEQNRLEAVAVADRISRRGLPVEGLEEIVDLPRRVLLHDAAGDLPPESQADVARLRSALNIVRSNPVTWDERTLALIKEVAERVDGELGKFAQRASVTLERGLAERVSGWSPKRDPGER